MEETNSLTPEEKELRAAIDAILQSSAQKKLVIAGPGTGKTTLFKQILSRMPGNPEHRIVLTFINNLKKDLEHDLAGLADVHTLHSYCLGSLYRDLSLRNGLSAEFICYPGLASIIGRDWEIIKGGESPKFVTEMRELLEDNHLSFYLERGNYYDAVDFDDSVYRAYIGFSSGGRLPKKYELVLIDEYQDFNKLEAGIVDILGDQNRILIAGDDDQALYGQLRDASWDYIRSLRDRGDYKVFELPFCMRCPKVIVDTVNEIVIKARSLNKLEGRINKPFKHFPLVKGKDSVKYPKICLVETSVQSKKINYMGRFITQEITRFPKDEIDSARSGGYPSVMVIVAKPYREQIIEYLRGNGFTVETSDKEDKGISREFALSLLKKDPRSNLGWRIILQIDAPSFYPDAIKATEDCGQPLVENIQNEYVERILSEVKEFTIAEDLPKAIQEEDKRNNVRITSFEGSKGMSAQHVFIVGLHEGEIPRDRRNIKDLEICKFIVGLTRTRKRCVLLNTRHFDRYWKNRSIFISWIKSENLENIVVNKKYWENQK